MKLPRQQRAETTRDRILDNAERLFDERGYAKTSMSALADASDVSAGGLYEWFKNKEAVVTAVAERHVQVAADSILTRLSDSPNAGVEEQITIVLEQALAQHQSKPALHRFLYSEAPRPPELRVKLKAFDDVLEVSSIASMYLLSVERR